MTLLDILDKDLIKVPLLSTNKIDLVNELLEVYRAKNDIPYDSFNTLKNAILEREVQAPTAMENGIAIPHAKIPGLEKAAVIIGVSRLGIDFGADEKSKVFFMVLAPTDKPSEHIQLLASIAKLCSSPVLSRMLQGVKTKDELYQLLMD